MSLPESGRLANHMASTLLAHLRREFRTFSDEVAGRIGAQMKGPAEKAKFAMGLLFGFVIIASYYEAIRGRLDQERAIEIALEKNEKRRGETLSASMAAGSQEESAKKKGTGGATIPDQCSATEGANARTQSKTVVNQDGKTTEKEESLATCYKCTVGGFVARAVAAAAWAIFRSSK
ncbi:unnamed protein product [Linum trigynum]|uniref:Uncharacterized protein n=1 Tax=Linum trigynum TaxID=586398 RepID=A0AAV2EVN3_9ROSI